MTLDELLSLPIAGKEILILGKPSAGKTWLAKQLDPYDLYTLHADEYIVLGEARALFGLVEDAPISFGMKCRIIEGMLGYNLLLSGAKTKTYKPDIVIEVEISAGKQRELYLKGRDPNKIRYLKNFQLKCMSIMDQYYKLVPESEMPQWITFNNEHNELPSPQGSGICH